MAIKICGQIDPDINNWLIAERQRLNINPDFLTYLKKLDTGIGVKELQLSDLELERVRLMCQLWDIDLRPSKISSHRKIIGPVIVAIKKLIFPILKLFLKDLIRQQKDFNAATIATVALALQTKKS